MTGTAQKDDRRAGHNEPRPVYLDYQATTPMDPRVLEAMMPYFTERFGNPHSRNHVHGWEAEEGVEKARAQLAALIGADEREIVFTSGATESNNLAIAGVARFYKDKRNHIVTLVTEHKCVLDTCRHLEGEGFEVSRAANGEEALRRLHDGSAPPGVILLDLMMPVMDGWTFLGAQRRDPAIAEIPVVVTSAEDGADGRQCAAQSGSESWC